MNTKPITNSVDTYLPIYEYRGFTIYRGQTPIWNKDCNYVDHNGQKCNDKKPLFNSLVTKNKSSNYYNNIYISKFGGNDGIENEYTPSQWEYARQQIDKHIESQREYKNKRIQVLKNSRFAVYELNNVTIRVLVEKSPYNKYENYYTIWVNENQLHNVCLKPDFVFNDVLKNVYYNTIAKYNRRKFSDSGLKTNYIRNKSFEKINISILPVYELLGLICKWGTIEFIPTNVRESNEGFIFSCYKDKDLEIPTEKIADIEPIGEVKDTLIDYVVLTNKIRFYA
jgi:hypothetical protein